MAAKLRKLSVEAWTTRRAEYRVPYAIDRYTHTVTIITRLHQAWPGSELIFDEGEGHGGNAMVEAWIATNIRHADRISSAEGRFRANRAADFYTGAARTLVRDRAAFRAARISPMGAAAGGSRVKSDAAQ